jgi:predicted RNA-binding Zn-ribbon protein involved in translation (DUF1610 family)
MRAQVDGLATNQQCPACGNTEWAWPPDQVALILWAARDEGKWTPTGRVHPAIGFVCTQCGYLRLHLRVVLNDGPAVADTL